MHCDTFVEKSCFKYERFWKWNLFHYFEWVSAAPLLAIVCYLWKRKPTNKNILNISNLWNMKAKHFSLLWMSLCSNLPSFRSNAGLIFMSMGKQQRRTFARKQKYSPSYISRSILCLPCFFSAFYIWLFLFFSMFVTYRNCSVRKEIFWVISRNENGNVGHFFDWAFASLNDQEW